MNTNSYTIVKREYSIGVWDSITPLEIDVFQWIDNGYKPRTYVKLFHDGDNIYVQFTSYENEITAKYKNMNDPVCEDSCVEFFFCPCGEKEYINFEINAIGTLLLGIGENRYKRKSITESPQRFAIKSSVSDSESYENSKWIIEYKIPFSFLKEYYKTFNVQDGLRANFYKCGDETAFPHYGMWCPIKTPEPDFHQSGFFGTIKFE